MRAVWVAWWLRGENGLGHVRPVDVPGLDVSLGAQPHPAVPVSALGEVELLALPVHVEYEEVVGEGRDLTQEGRVVVRRDGRRCAVGILRRSRLDGAGRGEGHGADQSGSDDRPLDGVLEHVFSLLAFSWRNSVRPMRRGRDFSGIVLAIKK